MADPYDYTKSTYSGSGALPAWANDPTKLTADVTSGLAGDMQSATPYQPSDNALVSKNLTKLLSADNPYITSARTRAASYSNSRGLLNSSIGAGAGESAAIDASLPIAQGDAANYFTAERDNNQNTNAFALDANRFGRESALTAARAGFDMGTQSRALQAQAAESSATRAQSSDQFGQDIGLRKDTLAQDATLRSRGLDIQAGDLALRTKTAADDLGLRTADQGLKAQDLARMTAADAAQVTQKNAVLIQEMQRTYMDARSQLETSPNLDTKAKANAINAMNDWYLNNALPSLRASLGNPTAWPATSSEKDANNGYVGLDSTLGPAKTNNNASIGEILQAIEDAKLREMQAIEDANLRETQPGGNKYYQP